MMINHQGKHAMYLFTLHNRSFTVAAVNTSKWVDGYAKNNEALLVWEITRSQKCFALDWKVSI